MKSIKELEELLIACELSIEVDPDNALTTKAIIRDLLKETPLNAWENICKILANGRSELSAELSREIIAQKIFSKNRQRTRIDEFDELQRTEANPRGAIRPKSDGLAHSTGILTAYNTEKNLKRPRDEDAPVPESQEENLKKKTKTQECGILLPIWEKVGRQRRMRVTP